MNTDTPAWVTRSVPEWADCCSGSSLLFARGGHCGFLLSASWHEHMQQSVFQAAVLHSVKSVGFNEPKAAVSASIASYGPDKGGFLIDG